MMLSRQEKSSSKGRPPASHSALKYWGGIIQTGALVNRGSAKGWATPVRGILEAGEASAGAFGPGYLDAQEIWGLQKEYRAAKNGACR